MDLFPHPTEFDLFKKKNPNKTTGSTFSNSRNREMGAGNSKYQRIRVFVRNFLSHGFDLMSKKKK